MPEIDPAPPVVEDPADAAAEPGDAPVPPVEAGDLGVLPGADDPAAGVPDLPLPVMPPQPSGPPKKSQIITLNERFQPVPLAGVTLIPDTRQRIGDTFTPSIEPVAGFSTLGGLIDPPDRAGLEAKLREKFMGKPLTFGGLEELVQTIQGHYIDQGRQLTHVFIPAQLMTDKVLVAILEGKVTKLDAENVEPAGRGWWASWYDEPYDLDDIAQEVRKEVGQVETVEPAQLSELLVDLNRSLWARLNRPIQHPFRRINAKYSPVDDLIGQTEVTLQVEQSRPLRFFLGYDNTLTELLDEHRIFAGAVWYDAFAMNWDHQLAFQVFSAADSSNLLGGALSYVIPWNRGKQTTEFYAAYVETEADIKIGGLSSSVGGESVLFGFRHFFELPPLVDGGELVRGDRLTGDKTPWWSLGKADRQTFGIFHEIGVGFDFKTTDNNLEFGGTTIAADSADIAQFVIEYNLRQTDLGGETNFSWKNFISPGGLLGNNGDDDFQQLRALSDSTYYYTRLDLERQQDLPWGMLAKARITGQYATENLLQSEQLGYGGHNTVRGYHERVFRGDNGWLASFELYSPPMHPLASLWPSLGWRDELRFLVFTDWGSGSAVNEVTADPFDDDQTLGSVGIGLRYDINDNFRLRVDWGFQVEKLPSPPYSDSRDNRLHVGMVWTF